MPEKLPHKRRLSRGWWITSLGIAIAIAGVVLTWVFGLGPYLNQRGLERQAERKFCILVPLQAEDLEYNAWSAGQTITYSKKVSGDVRVSIDAGVDAFFDGPERRAQLSLRREQTKVLYFPEGYDEKTYKEGVEKVIQQAQTLGCEVAGVIGHVSSTATEVYGSLYAQYDLPMILPMATATSLPSDLRSKGVPAVLRLVPTNENQALVIAKFLLSKGLLRAIVVKDLSNVVYSDDLANAFRVFFARQPFSKTDGVGLEVDPGRILATIPTGGQQGLPVLYYGLSELSPDSVMLFSMTESSLETLAELQATKVRPKVVVLTDGAVDEYLRPRLNAAVTGPEGGAPFVQKIYMTFPLEEPMPHLLWSRVFQPFVTDDAERKDLFLTHARYLVDAVQMVLSVLDQEVKKPRRSGTAKEVLTTAIKRWEKAERTEPGMLTYDLERNYKLDDYGNNNGETFHFYEITVPVTQGENWEHLPGSECPGKHSEVKG